VGLRVHLEQADLRAAQDRLDHPELQEHRVQADRLAQAERLATQAVQVHPEQVGLRVHLAVQDRVDIRVQHMVIFTILVARFMHLILMY
jgi:hypothetical protein